ncbi:acyltransferase family protein [Sphingobium sp. B12D2B]|uniref:acyltransferase family protein n=1 Tax=Sphingobium sp. B12D2B TaxID=2940577 RepID=UPI002224FD3C|nr:acyltransferase [Sphingobium sp. B12D2B]
MEGVGSSRHHYKVLDSLRGICACMVLLLHVKTQGRISNAALVEHASLFVDFFFVLSGFVIGASYGKRLVDGYSVGHFMRKRIARVYPLHFAMLVCFVLFELCLLIFGGDRLGRPAFEGLQSPKNLIDALLLIQIFPGGDPMAWNFPSWSIAAEVWIYLVFALVLRTAGRHLVPICLGIAVAVPLLLLSQPDFSPVMYQNALLRCAMGFALGLVGWRCMNRIKAMQLPAWTDHGLELVTAIALVAFISCLGGGRLSVLSPFLFLIAVLVFGREKGVVSDCLKRPKVVEIGALSYSIYLIHIFLYYRLLNLLSVIERHVAVDLVVDTQTGKAIGGGVWIGDGISILFLIFVMGCASLSRRLIEGPGRALFETYLSAPGAQPAHLEVSAQTSDVVAADGQ